MNKERAEKKSCLFLHQIENKTEVIEPIDKTIMEKPEKCEEEVEKMENASEAHGIKNLEFNWEENKIKKLWDSSKTESTEGKFNKIYFIFSGELCL